MNADQYLVMIDWAMPTLPTHVGPFPDEEAATTWAHTHIANGEWGISIITHPSAATA